MEEQVVLMTEAQGAQVIQLLSDISGKLDKLNDILLKVNAMDFYVGLLIGAIVGLVFWNVAKGVSH